uniref:DEAD-box ATP-dependent RNA helicase 52-like n=1 Tax=Erigeron canadensis TaxID=72917 RepID=UPI001CB974EC|nr:DEAD-box ATP-dependent RNA helicase 52-like [Erigeron canadensis]
MSSYSYFSDTYADVAAKPGRYPGRPNYYQPQLRRTTPTTPYIHPHGRGRPGPGPGSGMTRTGYQYHDTNNLANRFNQLSVNEKETEFEKDDNTGINFDAYEDIPVDVTGSDVPDPVNKFTDIDLGRVLNENIRERCKYVKPTPIQRHAIPVIMAGRDLMACAQTGSGKTAAFCFPIISGVLKVPSAKIPVVYGRRERVAYPLALILSPTRELCCQIFEEAKKFCYQTGVRVAVAYGGAPRYEQLRNFERGVDILVATPGRLTDMIEISRVSLNKIKYLALDEADRMLDMGFEPQIRKIVERLNMPPPGRRQTMLFSATFPAEIQRLASDFLSNYIFLSVGRVGSSTDLIVQKVVFVEDSEKQEYLRNLLHDQKANGNLGKNALNLIFVETKRGADSLERWLGKMGFPAIAIHGDKVQFERERALRSFKLGVTPILVATDVASRGLDIPRVAHVINFDLPRDIDSYVHRIGRTGRAGKSGLATAFFNDKNSCIAKALSELMIEAHQEAPDWLNQYAESYAALNEQNYGSNKFGGRDFRNRNDSSYGTADYDNASDGNDYYAYSQTMNGTASGGYDHYAPTPLNGDYGGTSNGFDSYASQPVAADFGGGADWE